MHSAAAKSRPQQPLQRGYAHQHPQRNPQEQQQQQNPFSLFMHIYIKYLRKIYLYIK